MVRARRDINDMIGKTVSFKRACEFKYKDSAKIIFAGEMRTNYIDSYKAKAVGDEPSGTKNYYANSHSCIHSFEGTVGDYINAHCFDKHKHDSRNALACDDKLFDR